MKAFDLAERFQTPIFVMTDLDLGMNNWVADPLPYPENPLDRGKVIRTAEEFAAHLQKYREFARYRDVDGDGVPWRTLPGVLDIPAATYFTRGSGHSERATYTERPDEYQDNMDRIARKFETARRFVPAPVISPRPGAAIGIVAYGSSEPAVAEACVLLERKGIAADYLRVRALPFGPEIADFVAGHERVYVVDQNRDAQMYDLIRLDVAPADVPRLRSLRHYDGFPLDAETVVEGVEAGEKN
jgi:2-oxoglutarate ferredoxin oxidoreductase subunit alpha